MACGVPINKESVAYPPGYGEAGILARRKSSGACRSDLAA